VVTSGLVPPIIVTRAGASLTSTASTVVVRGSTLVSNLGRCLEAHRGGGEGGGDTRMWCDGEPSGVDNVPWLEGIWSLDGVDDTPCPTDA
jgi:hypothetical protein